MITGSYTIEEARRTAQDIKTGIVPAPIYLSSERTIDAKIGRDALHVIIVAGAIGLAAIIVFLVMIYRVSGLIAGIALVIYALILVAIVKSFARLHRRYDPLYWACYRCKYSDIRENERSSSRKAQSCRSYHSWI